MPRTTSLRTQSTRQASARKLYEDQQGDGLIGGLVGLFFAVIISIVALRLIFQLFGADASNAMVAWVYSASQPLVSPFTSIFSQQYNFLTGQLEMATLLALVVYSIIASLVTRLFGGYPRSHAI